MSWQPRKPTTSTTQKDGKDNQAEDACLPSPPADGISCLSVNATSNMLIAGCWDNTVRTYINLF